MTVTDPFASDVDEAVDPEREPVVLGDAATEALVDFGGDDEQLAIVPACKVKFVGMAWDSLDDVPPLKAEMTFTVTGRVIGHGQQVMRDGEIRETATVEVSSVQKV